MMSSKDSGESQLMHSKNNNIETMIGNNINETINELFTSLFSRYQISLETSMKSSNFAFDWIDGMYYKCHRTSVNRDGLNIGFTNWIKNKKINNKSKKIMTINVFNDCDFALIEFRCVLFL